MTTWRAGLEFPTACPANDAVHTGLDFARDVVLVFEATIAFLKSVWNRKTPVASFGQSRRICEATSLCVYFTWASWRDLRSSISSGYALVRLGWIDARARHFVWQSLFPNSPSGSQTQAPPPLMTAAKLMPTEPSTHTRPPVMHSQQWSPSNQDDVVIWNLGGLLLVGTLLLWTSIRHCIREK